MTSLIAFFLWYLLISLVGWLAFPLAYRLLPNLRDRGLALARPLGLLLWGFIFWLLGMLRVAQNDSGGMLLALALVALLSIWAGWRDRFGGALGWLRANHKLVLTGEALFLLAFAAWTLVRSANPEIQYTEKPMELAFLNAILKSPVLPPHDPWLSGYAISYYYFGYVMVAMLTRLTGTLPEVAFNLALALWFALTAAGAYGVVHNLLAAWGGKRKSALEPAVTRAPAGLLGLPLLGPLFVLILSNLEGFLDVLHARGLFWSRDASGNWVSGFWKWLDIQELSVAPPEPFSWMPQRASSWLWWRASRVLNDYSFSRGSKEVIDEFPFFSYLLGDMHPHVLAMPFALLAIGLALNLYLGARQKGFRLAGVYLPLDWPFWLLSALALGGLAFLNTWDFPIYIALFSAAYALRRYQDEGWSWRRAGEFFGLAAGLGISGVLLYLPFYIGFSSQAGGILPSAIYFTRGAHFWVMFGTLLVPLFALLAYLWLERGRRRALRFGALTSGALLVGLFAFSMLLAWIAGMLPNLGGLFLDNQGAAGVGIGDLLSETLLRRLVAPGAWITLGLLLALAFALLALRIANNRKVESVESAESASPVDSVPFVVLLVVVGALLALAPEFVYLRDQFGSRMNTIFKFYFQTWILWALAGAFGVGLLFNALSRRASALFSIVLVLVLFCGLVYPAWALPNKTSNFAPEGGLTLNGNVLARNNPDDAAAAEWLRSAPLGVLAEAVGNAYSDYGRMSVYSGQPAVLGWENHENQWRGGFEEMGSRRADIETLYHSSDWAEAQEIIARYGIRYVYVGTLERASYRVSESKFQRFLTPAFQSGAVVVYEVPQQVGSAPVDPVSGFSQP